MESCLWIVPLIILPHSNLGLLSDYKICGDPECETPISRVEAIKSHQGKDCRFLNFRRGDTIFVYHKLTGKREDLWAGSIDKQFGYFPKDAVQEEEIFVTTRKVLEAQKSDFFCMDESGYPVDTSHLDTDEDDDHDFQIREPESIQISPHSHDTNAQASMTSTDSTVKEREDEDGNKDLNDSAELLEDGLKTTATPEEQGGSPSSWLHSSVTEWLGSAKEEQSGDSEQGVREDEREETKSEASLTSSVTGWLGLGGEGKPNNDEDNVKMEDSFTSTMTGWLGFGEKKETVAVENVENEEAGNEKDPTVTFRSRRMSLDLEGSKLKEEEKEDMGTLGWLGSELSDRLGFGSSAQDSGGEGDGVKEQQSESSSWLEMRIGGIWGFEDSNTGGDGSKEGSIREIEKDQMLEQPSGSEHVGISQSQASFSEENKAETEESLIKELVNVPSTLPVSAESGDPENDNIDNSDTKEVNILDTDAGIEVFSKDDLIPNSSQIVVENMGEHTIRDQQISRNDEFIERPEISLGPDHVLKDLDSNSLEQLEGIIEEGENHYIQIKPLEMSKEEGTEIPNQVHTLEQSILTSEKGPVSGDDHKGEQFNKATGLSQQEILGDRSEESPVETQISDDQEDSNEQSQLVFPSLETEIRQEESGQQQGTQPVKVSSQDDGAIISENKESLYGNVSEEDEVEISETTQNLNKTSESLQRENEVVQKDNDADRFKETVKDQNELTEKDTSHFEKEVLNEIKLKPTVASEKENEATEGLKELEKVKYKKHEDVNEVKEQIMEVKQEGQQRKLEDINKKGFFEEERGLREESQKEEEEIGAGEEWYTLLLEHEQPKVERLKESEEPNKKEQEKEEKIAEVSWESTSEEGMKLREEMQKDVTKGNEEDKKVEELQDQGNQLRVEELKESAEQNEKEEKADVSVDRKGEMELEKEMCKEVEELKEEETQQTELLEQEQATVERLEESGEPNRKIEEAKEKETDFFDGGDREEQKDFGEKRQDEDHEPREEEKRVKELVEHENKVRVEELKEYVEQTKKEKKEDEKQGQLEYKKTDIWGSELENLEKEMLDNSSLASLVSKTNTQTEIKNFEEEEKEGERQNKEESEEEKEPLIKKIEADNVDVSGFEDGEWTGKLNDDSNWKEDRHDNGFEEEIRETYATKNGNEFHRDREQTYDSAESQVQTSEQTESIHPPGGTESESRGAFGLFKNAFGFFSQTPIPVMTESTQSVQNYDTNSAETSEPHASFTPELDSPSHSFHAEVTHTAFPMEQAQPQPISAENLLHNAPSVTEEHSKTKTLTKHYNNLLRHMKVDQTVILQDLFGRHKLQFLDYILTSSEAATADDDQSILSDIERLLQHHMETLFAPRMSITDAPQEEEQRTSAIIALQKLETLLKTVKETVSTGISDVSNHQAEHNPSQTKEKEENSQPLSLHKDDDGKLKYWNYVEEKRRDEGSTENTASFYLTQPGSRQQGFTEQTLEFIHRVAEDSISCAHALMEILVWIIVQAVSLLPDDMRPGPDLYGVPWEPVIFTGLMGLVTFLLFTSRCYRSMKSRLYQRKEQRMAEQVGQLLDEKCKVLQTLSQCQEEYNDLENLLGDSGVLAQTQKSEHLEVQAKRLEQTKKQLGTDIGHLKEQLAQQQEHRKEQERRIALLEESMKACEEETKELHSKEEQAQTTLKIYNMSSERLQKNLETVEEENTVLQESNTQLKQEVEGWAERVSELEAEMRRCEVAHSAMMQDVAIKDERIMSLTDRLLGMKCWDSDLGDEERGEKEATNGKEVDTHLQKVQKLIFAAKLNADLKSVDEDKERVFAKLNDEIKAKEDLQVSIEEMEKEKLSLQSDTENYTGQVERIQQKLQIMTELYQENELKLHRMLTVEEKERHQKEEKLSKADKNIAMAMEELNNYRKRAEEMEEELEKTKQSYQTQISSHEKKAHNNWLAARSAERELGDIRRENALLRQKLTDTQFKLDTLDKDPYALNNLARPLPFRAERSPYAPSPLGRPSSETRPFLSPPTLMDGLPGRLSPRVSRGPGEPSSGQAEMERSGGPHSDSGSLSPTWERDRRVPPPGPLGPPGYMFPEPGGPMFRRPPPPPGALGPLPPPPGPMPPRGLPLGPPHPLDMADGSFRVNRLGPGEQEHRESGPGGQRTPPELDPRMGGPPPPGPPGIPIDGPYPRRAPYGPLPPPDFYPPRIPGGPPMRPMWSPHPQGMMLPPRFSSGGPHPNIPYGHPMALPPSDGFPPPSMGPPPPRQQSLPSPPQSQLPEENRPIPEDAI